MKLVLLYKDHPMVFSFFGLLRKYQIINMNMITGIKNNKYGQSDNSGRFVVRVSFMVQFIFTQNQKTFLLAPVTHLQLIVAFQQ